MSHVLLATTGCAGSSLLMAIFTKLGMDTGFEFEEPRSTLNDVDIFGSMYEMAINGTTGQDMYDKGFPYILKNSYLTWQLCDRIKTFDLEVDHVYGLLRGPTLWASVRERCDRHSPRFHPANWEERIMDPSFVRTVEDQHRDLDSKAARMCIDLSYLDVPCTMLSYPTYATDLPLTYKKLEFLMTRYDISYDRFKEVCDDLIDQEVVDMALEFYKDFKATSFKW